MSYEVRKLSDFGETVLRDYLKSKSIEQIAAEVISVANVYLERHDTCQSTMEKNKKDCADLKAAKSKLDKLVTALSDLSPTALRVLEMRFHKPVMDNVKTFTPVRIDETEEGEAQLPIFTDSTVARRLNEIESAIKAALVDLRSPLITIKEFPEGSPYVKAYFTEWGKTGQPKRTHALELAKSIAEIFRKHGLDATTTRGGKFESLLSELSSLLEFSTAEDCHDLARKALSEKGI